MPVFSRSVAALAILIAAAIAGGVLYVVTQTGQGVTATTTSSTTNIISPDVRLVFDRHLSRISSRDIPLLLTDYEDKAVVLWTGNTAGLGGIYNGTEKIKILFANALSTARQVELTSTDYSQINGSSTKASVQSTIGIGGSSQFLGPFNGTIDAQLTFKNDNGTWKISHENWFYRVLNYSTAGGATTFPEWQKVGPINPSRRSTDWLHNFAWDYGGPGVAFLTWSYAALIAVVVLARGVRRRSPESSSNSEESSNSQPPSLGSKRNH